MLPSWVRVSNAVVDPVTKTSLAQDQLVLVKGEQDDWYTIETFDGEAGRVPKVLANPITNPLRVPTESVYCTTAEFEAQGETDLSLGLYTIIVVDSVDSEAAGWLRGTAVTDTGKRLGASGTFPASYVKQMNGFVAPSSETSRSAGIPTSFTSDFTTDVRFRQTDVGPYARAIYDFQGEYDSELSFTSDEMIQLTRRIDADWLEGSAGGRTGMFPQSYVQVVVPLPGETEGDDRRHSTQEEGIGFAIVRHDFEGRQKDELSVHMGDSVRVLQMVNADWVSCRDPSSDASGIVPLAFLELYLDEDEDEVANRNSRPPSTLDQSFGTLANASFTAPSSMPDWRTSTRLDDTAEQAPAYPSPSSQSQSTPQWATFGEEWLVPEKKTAPPARPPPPKVYTSPTQALSVTDMFGFGVEQKTKTDTPRPEMSDLSSFTATLTSTSDPDTQKEKRNKVLEELINTEFQFVLDMNAYTEAVDASTRLSTKQKAMMKSGCAQIIELAGVLVQALTTQQVKEWDQQAVGACFLELRKPFAQTYGYYFRNIEHINALVNLSTTDQKLEGALKEIVSRMKEAGAGVFDTPTAVTRPIQRCVKYPLFLSEIAKFTPIHHPDHPKLLEAVKQMSTLGQKMNESKRRKELTRKYTEEQTTSSSNSLGDMLSKFTVHSIKKKSNRFTYRMGSSLGVLKVARDGDFDQLVGDLDGCERRLVRFNYMLVIYKKRMVYETKQLINKRLIDIRKRQVITIGMNMDKQVQPFHDELRLFSEQLNIKVRDEIVKALRAIPKKLIKKRNDKLMDWEAAKSKGNANQNGKFLDFEALNSQVKQTLPKVIDVLNKVLHDAMITVRALDDHVISQMKFRYAAEADDAAKDPYQINRLIVPGIPCFALYYDVQRLQGLQAIVTKAERKMRGRAYTTDSVETNEAKKAAKKSTRSASQKQKKEAIAASLSKPNEPETPIPSTPKTFRAQNMSERKAILDKADAKGRRMDMYRCTGDWPPTGTELVEMMETGKNLIVRQGDAVLACNREGAMWLCYNGFYNAPLPHSILTPYYANEARNDTLNLFTVSNAYTRQSAVVTRPHSTPPKQSVSANLIDLDDSPVLTSQPPLAPIQISALVPTPVGAAAALTPTPSTGATASPSAPQQTNGVTSIFDGVRPVDWGASSSINTNPWTSPAPPTDSNPWGEPPCSSSSLSQRTPSLPNLAKSSTPNAFPVTFDESPRVPDAFAPPVPSPVIAHLPPMAPSRPAPSTSSNSAAAPSADAFTTLWEQIKDQPLSKINQRSESPQPLIPTRPQPAAAPANLSIPLYSNIGTLSPSQPVQALTPMQLAWQGNSQPAQASYDTVPVEMYSKPPVNYSMPPPYDMPPSNAQRGNMNGGPNQSYEQPPREVVSSASALYDAPPTEALTPEKKDGSEKPEIGKVRVCFDFAPVGPNQIAVQEGETVALLQGHDDDGNPEWIWVRRVGGVNGYVPAAYCQAL